MHWVSLTVAPLVAAIQVGIGYAMVKPACGSGSLAGLAMLSAGLAVVAAAGTYAGWRSRRRFLGVLGFALNVLVLVLVFASSLALVVRSPCE